MKCEYQDCNEKASVYLESVNCSYCEYHFKQVAYDILGKKKLLAIIGKKIQVSLGVAI
ncbi:MAG: hypothetical protein QXR09_01040 [Candidatus Aenigmatarchaeota archaeon]